MDEEIRKKILPASDYDATLRPRPLVVNGQRILHRTYR